MNTIQQSLTRIEHVWRDTAPGSLAALRRPASKQSRARLTKAFANAPPELEALYALHDGMNDREPFVNGGTLLSVSEATELYEIHCEELDAPSCTLTTDPRIRNDRRWCNRWWPLTDADGDHFVLDMAPGPGGTVGQIITFDNSYARPRVVLAPSLAAWLKAYADLLERGEFTVEDMGVWIPSFQG